VLVPLPDGRWLELAQEAFEAALAAGAARMPNARGTNPSATEPLVDAEQLAKDLSLPVTWIEQAAREERIPSVQAGRWRRFDRAAVRQALGRNGA
jgi:excisionase family DNA binding protein